MHQFQYLEKIDNLGGGHCGFISFIIGALHLENTKQVSDFVGRWKELDPDISSLLDIAKTLELKTLAQNISIIDLCDSLRKILADHYLKSLPEYPETKNVYYYQRAPHDLIFNEFSDLFNSAISERKGLGINSMPTNIFWESDLKFIAIDIAQLAIEHKITDKNEKHQSIYLHAAMVFYRESIQKALGDWSRSRFWMTEAQAFLLSEIFDIPVVIDPRKCQRPAKPFIHLHNLNNVHWICLLYNQHYPYSFLENSPEQQFRALKNDYFNSVIIQNVENHIDRGILIADLIARFDHIDEVVDKVFDQYLIKFNELKKHKDSREFFLEHQDNIQFFSLYSSCIDEKKNQPYREHEYQMALLKLLMFIDEPSKKSAYQEEIDACMLIRYNLGEEEALFNDYSKLLLHNQRLLDASIIDQIELESKEDDEYNDENVHEFLSTPKFDFTVHGFWTGLILSSITGGIMLMISSKLILPALAAIVLTTITATLLGALMDWTQADIDEYSYSSRSQFNPSLI